MTPQQWSEECKRLATPNQWSELYHFLKNSPSGREDFWNHFVIEDPQTTGFQVFGETHRKKFTLFHLLIARRAPMALFDLCYQQGSDIHKKGQYFNHSFTPLEMCVWKTLEYRLNHKKNDMNQRYIRWFLIQGAHLTETFDQAFEKNKTYVSLFWQETYGFIQSIQEQLLLQKELTSSNETIKDKNRL